MKKIIVLCLLVSILLGCSATSKFPYGKDIGSGSVEFVAPKQYFRNSKFVLDDNILLVEVLVITHDFDRRVDTNIYFDDKLIDTVRLSDSEYKIRLENERLESGKHRIALVQYDGENIVLYKEIVFEVM